MRTLTISKRLAEVIHVAGGQVVGRTRLQKLVYLLEASGFGLGIRFYYKHYGPYSEELADAVSFATLMGDISEEEHSANWGGKYSIYSCRLNQSPQLGSAERQLIELACRVDAVELELAATALYLNSEGYTGASAWAETIRRKPEKAVQPRLERAKQLYKEMRSLDTPTRLPALS